MKSKVRRILAAFLSVVILMSAPYIQTLAATWGSGDSVYAAMLDNYSGYDNSPYGDKRNYKYIIYNSSGTTSVGNRTASNHAKLGISKNGIIQQAICIEAGVSYSTNSTYTGVSSSSSDYMSRLPDNVQYMLKLALLCGFNSDTTSSPISRTNLDDFSFATQVIVWEIQQQLRTGYNPGDLKSNSVGTPAKVFYEQLQGRPAEKCYNHILSKMKNYATIPSFTSSASASAPTHLMKYNSSNKTYSVTLTDNTNSGIPVSAFNISGITVTKNGNKYTFSTSTKFTGTKSCTYKANRTNGDSLVIWKSNSNYQTMAAGIDDPVKFYANFKIENSGTIKINKNWVHNNDNSSTKGTYNSAYFTIKNSSGTIIKATGSAGSYSYSSSGSVTKLKLNSSNTLTISGLPTDTYTVYEYGYGDNDAIPYYTRNSGYLTANVSAGSTSSLTFTNTRNIGTLKVNKTWVHNKAQTANYNDVYFTVKNSNGDFVKASGSAGSYTYSSVATDAGTKFKLNSSNTFSLSKLPTGTYTVYEYGNDGGGIPYYTRTAGYISTSISTGNTSTITFTNTRNLGTGVIAKTWSGSPTASEKVTLNAAVSFYIVDNDSGKFVTATGDAGNYEFNGLTTSTPPQFFYLDSSTGKLTISNLPTGEYKIYESGRPSGYNPDTNPLTMTVSKGKTSTVTFNNNAGKGTGKIIKSWEDATLTTSQRTTLNAKIQFLIHDVNNGYITGTGSSGSYTFSGYSGKGGPTYFTINTSTSTATISNLPAGEYTVIETSRPAGYAPKDNGSKEFTIKANATTSVTITNYNTAGTGTAKVLKKWASTSTLSTSEITALESNVYFTVQNSSGNYVLATGSAGAYTYRGTSSTQTAKYRLSNSAFSISSLPTGTYTITEYCSADGYNSYDSSKSTIPTEKTQTISVVNGTTKSVTFTNIETPILKVRKHLSDEANLTDEEKRAEYAKISFKVMCLGIDGSETGTGPNGLYVTATGSDGDYTCTGLTSVGTTFNLNDSGSAEVNMLWNGAAPYYYKVIEYYDGTDYTLDTEEKNVIFSNGNPNAMLEVKDVVFNNTVKPGNLEVSKVFLGPDGTEDAPTSAQISNIKFKIKNKDGKYLTFTGSNGNYTYSGLNTTGTELNLNSDAKLFANDLPARQTYYISEIQGTEGYNYTTDSVTFTILPNETTDDVKFINKAQSGTLKIAKHSADNNLGGWQFRVKLVDSVFANYTYDKVFTTDINGLITVENLRIGKYEISEVTDNVIGYFTPDAQTVEITAGNTVTTNMTNVPYGSVHVTKVDSDYVNDKLTGAVFKVYNSTKSTIVGTLTEISTGEYQLDNLPFGDYYLRETTAPTNYIPNTSTYYAFSISEAGKTVKVGIAEGRDFENAPKTGTLKIQKASADGILENWKFRVKLVTSPFTEYTYDETFTTDANGLITISNLRIGTYQVSEVTTGITGYTTPAAQTVEVKYNATATVNMKNTPYGSVHVTKVDKDYPNVKLTGAVFNVYNSSKSTVIGTLTEISTGEYQLDEIPYGSYYLREITSPTNYVNNTNYYAFSITQAGQLVTVETKTGVGFENTAKTGTLKIQKASADGVLSGWKFRVKLTSSQFESYTYDKTFTTDANGLITISNLRIGTYQVSEVTTGITGYTTPAAQTVEVKYNTTATVNMKNTPYGSVHVTKVDKDYPNVKLTGAVFKVYNENKTGVVGTLTEISTGEYQFDNLPYGKYNLLETTSPTNYIPNNSTFYPFSITQAGQLVKVETKAGVGFENTAKTGTLKIQKVSADGVLSGWKFRVKLTSSQFEGYTYDKTFTTDSNGLITISNLRIGTYQVSEVTTGITGYVTPAAQTIEVKYNTTSTVNMTNTPYGSVHVTKVDKDYPNVKLTGAVFKVYASNKSTVIGTLTEISTGEYQLNNIPYGSYYLKETSAPANYYVDSTYYAFSISTAGSVVNVETKTGVGFENKAQGGAIKIVKHSADNVLNGWKFRIQLVESPFESYTYDKTLTTDSNGLISISGLRVGKYKISEVTTGVTGYITPEAQTIEVTAGSTITVDMTNVPSGSVHVTKVDKDYPNRKLSGAVFKVYSSNKTTVIGTLAEISSGEYQLDNIPCGSYYLKETTAPSNYYVDSTFYAFTINAAGEIAVVETTEGIGFENKAQGGAIKVVKHSADNVLSDWKFRIQLIESPFESYTYDKTFSTDVNGLISISGLRIGKYKVSEVTTGVTNYITPEAQTIEVTAGNSVTVEMTNIPCGSVHTTKVDKDYPNVKLTGAVFKVYTSDKSSVIGTLSEISTGEYQLDGIPQGSYYLKEVTAPTNYYVDSTFYTFTINAAGEVAVVETTEGIGFENKAQGGAIKVVKHSADNVLSGWKFRIQLVESPFDNYTYDKSFTTNTNGIISISGLRIGKYKVSEVTTGVTDYITPEAQTVEVTTGSTITVDMTNIPYGTISLTKVDSQNTSKKLSGAKFVVYKDANSNGTYESSVDAEYKDLIDNGDGTYSLDEVPYGKYLVKEVLAPTGYCIDNHYYSIFIDGAGAIGQVNNSDDGLFHNEPVTGSVKLTKVDADYPDIKLAGAEFTVYASDKTTVIGVLTETEKGIYRLDGLSYGEYYLKETKAPEYFVLDENYYYFQIANANETIDMNNSGYGEGVFINSPQSGTIKIVKTSADGNVEGLSFLVTGTISTGEEYNETFITDENGIIIIDNLRAGEYTIRELNSDISAGKELSAEYSVTVKNEHIN